MRAAFTIKRYLPLFIAFFFCVSVTAGSAAPAGASASRAGEIMFLIEEGPVPLAGGAKVLKPDNPGTVSYGSDGATLDASNAAEGYVMIKYAGAASRAKVRITHGGKTTYSYNLRTDGKYEVYPLTCGDGAYQIAVFYNLYDNQYVQVMSQNIDVKLRDAMLPFLYPNQYVNFTADSKAVAKSEELAKDAENDFAVISSVYNYVIGAITYDNEKAQKAAAGRLNGYLPDVDGVLAAKKGICFDYAALMTAMLRAQQIPTRMELGYVSGGLYHAWISTYIKDVGWVNGVIQFDGKSWKLMDPTFAASDGANSRYVGTGVNYQTMYRY